MNTLAPSFLIGSSSFLQVTRPCMKALMNSNFGQNPLSAALERLKSMYDVVNTLITSFLIGSFSFLQAKRTTITSRMSSTFC